MGRHSLATTVLVVSILAIFGQHHDTSSGPAVAGREPVPVLQEHALVRAARGRLQRGPRQRASMPRDVVWRTERRLNDPDCRDSSTPDRCAATAGKRYQQSRLGWASADAERHLLRPQFAAAPLQPACERTYSWGKAREDYVLPEAHTVTIWIAAEKLEGVTGDCTWMWRPRRDGGKVETKKQACNNKLTIARVPYSRDAATSGVSVAVTLPDGRQFSERDVVVEDIFIVALGNSFASGESNPDRPVQFSPSREMVYDPTLLQDEVAPGPQKRNPACEGVRAVVKRSADQSEGAAAPADGRRAGRALPAAVVAGIPHLLRPGAGAVAQPRLPPLAIRLSGPRRPPARAGEPPPLGHARDLHLLRRRGRERPVPRDGSARGLQRAERQEGPRAARSTDRSLVPRQRARSRRPIRCRCTPTGSTSISQQRITMNWCPPNQRKRPIDVVLMSIGGNDVGFGGLVAYAMTESASDFAPIAAWVGSSIRFSPQVSRVYLERARRAHEGAQGGAASGLRRRAVARAADHLRADPV